MIGMRSFCRAGQVLRRKQVEVAQMDDLRGAVVWSFVNKDEPSAVLLIVGCRVRMAIRHCAAGSKLAAELGCR